MSKIIYLTKIVITFPVSCPNLRCSFLALIANVAESEPSYNHTAKCQTREITHTIKQIHKHTNATMHTSLPSLPMKAWKKIDLI